MTSEPLPVATAWVLCSLALAALAAAGWYAVGLLRGRQRLTDELREARARCDCLTPLLDHTWTWQSDAAYRVIAIRPPDGAAAGAWRTPGGVPAWQCFAAAAAAALQARIEAHAAFDAVPARLLGAGDTGCEGRLSGRPYVDAAGRFAGYHGTFRENATPAVAPAAPAPVVDNGPSEHESLSFTVSHDLRAPIRVVEGFTKILKEDYGPMLDRVGNDHLDRVLGAAARMNNMIDALLALSRLGSQPLQQQPVNLSQLAQYVIDDLHRQWPERAVAVRIEPELQVRGDPTLLRVVLENLLGNAWKYTAKTGAPQISLTRDGGARDAFLVADNGAGFDMRFADRLFGVFQRLHGNNEFPGTGIGLATVRRVVRRHGGDVWAEAEVNRGARFHFSLPQA